MSAVVRTGTAADLDGVMRIERASFPTDAWTSRAMAETFADPDVVALVAEDVEGAGDAAGTALVGYGAVLAPIGAGDADVLTIAVDAPVRGAGTGRALLRGLLGAAAARGAVRVFLEVRADNPLAQGLYESEGFVAVGRRPHYYQPDDVDAIVMRRGAE